MPTCSVKWRPSGGRGEFEFVPANSLLDREISVDFEPLGVRIAAEVRGIHAQGKPRLRKLEKNNRKKFHLPQLVMAVAGLPEPARSDQLHSVQFPLENKAFVMDSMDFDIIEDDGINVVLAPLRVSVLHTDFEVQFNDRLNAMAADVANINEIRQHSPELADAIETHVEVITQGVNSSELRNTADTLIALKTELFGLTNAGSATSLLKVNSVPEVEAEEFSGTEGRLLTRLHIYKERDRSFAKRVRNYYRNLGGGTLSCEACGARPIDTYGDPGDRGIEAHHKIPIEQLQPDSITLVQDMAMVCATCHRVIHSRIPCLTIDEVRDLIATYHK